METDQTTNLVQTFAKWIQESITVKLAIIGFLVLILLIPTAWITSLITERQRRAGEAMNEVASKWSGRQTISGPVMVIPYMKKEKAENPVSGFVERVERAYFLPDNLNISGSLQPTILHRGIFDAVVYSASVDISSGFRVPDLAALNIPEDQVLWKDVFFAFGISDLRGISQNPDVAIGGDSLQAEPSSNTGILISQSQKRNDDAPGGDSKEVRYSGSGILMKPGWSTKEDFNGKFSMKLALKGSKALQFIPAGKNTSVQLSGAWENPSFSGEFLPETRDVSKKGFTASWRILHFNRPFAQQWVNSEQKLEGADFGVELLIPVDQYQKSMRTAKYGVLIILLTFIALFLVEVLQKIRVHPFQYILIGAALTIYYSLLLSFSEHVGYNLSYLISSLATVTLIGLYAISFLNNVKLAVLFSTVLSCFYIFIFVIIQEQDYSLMIGSIGLFSIIGMLMYFSRKINWYSPGR